MKKDVKKEESYPINNEVELMEKYDLIRFQHPEPGSKLYYRSPINDYEILFSSIQEVEKYFTEDAEGIEKYNKYQEKMNILKELKRKQDIKNYKYKRKR